MLQDGGVYPGIRAREVTRLFCGLYGDRHDPDELLALVGLDQPGHQHVEAAVRGRAAAALARPRPRRRARGGLPRRADGVRGRQRPPGGAGDHPRPGRPGLLRAAHHPRARRGGAPRRPRGDRRPRQGRRRRVAGRACGPGRPAPRSASAPAAASTRARWPPSSAWPSPSRRPRSTWWPHRPTPAAIATIAGWLAERDVPLADLRASRETLEDVFLRLTGDSDR